MFLVFTSVLAGVVEDFVQGSLVKHVLDPATSWTVTALGAFIKKVGVQGVGAWLATQAKNVGRVGAAAVSVVLISVHLDVLAKLRRFKTRLGEHESYMILIVLGLIALGLTAALLGTLQWNFKKQLNATTQATEKLAAIERAAAEQLAATERVAAAQAQAAAEQLADARSAAAAQLDATERVAAEQLAAAERVAAAQAQAAAEQLAATERAAADRAQAAAAQLASTERALEATKDMAQRDENCLNQIVLAVDNLRTRVHTIRADQQKPAFSPDQKIRVPLQQL